MDVLALVMRCYAAAEWLFSNAKPRRLRLGTRKTKNKTAAGEGSGARGAWTRGAREAVLWMMRSRRRVWEFSSNRKFRGQSVCERHEKGVTLGVRGSWTRVLHAIDESKPEAKGNHTSSSPSFVDAEERIACSMSNLEVES